MLCIQPNPSRSIGDCLPFAGIIHSATHLGKPPTRSIQPSLATIQATRTVLDRQGDFQLRLVHSFNFHTRTLVLRVGQSWSNHKDTFQILALVAGRRTTSLSKNRSASIVSL